MPSFPRGRRQDWNDVASARSHNTGFTQGTGAFAPKFTKHAKERKLEREIDEAVIRHTVVRGYKSEVIGTDGAKRWKFEKDGVVVISSSSTPDQHVITTWFQDGSVDGALEARAERGYRMFLENLDDALDSEDRLHLLWRFLGGSSHVASADYVALAPVQLSRVVEGVDRALLPRDKPLLHYCVEAGYDECVRLLVSSTHFADAVGRRAKRGTTVLHLAAWFGRPEALDAFSRQDVIKLCDMKNDFHELPESTAWTRYCGGEPGTEGCLRVASMCALARLDPNAFASSQGKLEEYGASWFVNEADRDFQAFTADDSQIHARPGTSGDCVHMHLNRFRPQWRLLQLNLSSVNLSTCLGPVLSTQSTNSYLESLTLDRCSVRGQCSLMELRHFLLGRSGLTKLSLCSNFIGDAGLLELFFGREEKEGTNICTSSECALVPNLLLNDVGLSAQGLAEFAEKIRAADDEVRSRMRFLSLDKNDLSERSSSDVKFASFASFLRAPTTNLKELALRGTRLCEAQLSLLFDAMRVSPVLYRLSHQGVTLPDCFLKTSRHEANEMLDAIADPRCSVKYLELSALEYFSMNKMVTLKAKEREKRVLQEQVKRNSLVDQEKSQGGDIVQVGSTHMRCLRLDEPIVGRLREVVFVHPLYPNRVSIETPFGVIEKCDCESDETFLQSEEGSVCCIRLKFQNARLFVSKRLPVPDEIPRVSLQISKGDQSDVGKTCSSTKLDVLRAVGLAFVRLDTEEVLLLRDRDESVSASLLRERMKIGLFAEHLAAEARFQAGVSNKKMTRYFTHEELLSRVDLSCFSFLEVTALASFDSESGFAEFLKRGGELSPNARVVFGRIRELSVVHELAVTFREELDRRRAADSAGTELSDPASLRPLEQKCSHQSIMGLAESHVAFCWPLDRAISFLRTLATRDIGVDELVAESFVTLRNPEQTHHTVLGVVTTDSLDFDPRTRLPRGVQLNPDRCEWVALDKADSALVTFLTANGYTGFGDAVRGVVRGLNQKKPGRLVYKEVPRSK